MIKKTQTQLLTEFIEGLNEAIGAAGVMLHHHQDMRWHFLRKILEQTKDVTMRAAVNPLTAPKVMKHEKKTQILLP